MKRSCLAPPRLAALTVPRGALRALSLASIAALAAACTGSDSAGQVVHVNEVPAVAPVDAGTRADFDHTSLKPGVLTTSREQDDVVQVQRDKLVFPASDAAEVARQWPVGAPVVGNRKSSTGTGVNPFGYLRKVKGISSDGTNVVVATEPATLADVLTGDAHLSADPRVAIPIDTTGVNLDDYFGNYPAGAPPSAASGADAGAGDAGPDGGMMAMRRPPPPAQPHGLVPGRAPGHLRDEPIGSTKQADFGSFVSGVWSDTTQVVGDALSDGEAAAAAVTSGIPGIPYSVDYSAFFDITGTQSVFALQGVKKTFTSKRGKSVTVAISGTADLTGTMTYSPTFALDATIGVGGVTQFAASATGDFSLDAKLDVTTSVTAAPGTDPLDAVDLATLLAAGPETGKVDPVRVLSSKPIAGPVIAGIPTTYVMELWVDCSFGVQATMVGALDMTLSAPGSSVEVDYALPGIWTPKANVNLSPSAVGSITGGGGVSVECGITPRVNWLFADVGGPYLGIRGALRAHAGYVETCDATSKVSTHPDGQAKLGVDGILDATIGGSVDAWGVADLQLGEIGVWHHEWDDLWSKQYSYPKGGFGWCASHCDDAAKDSDETAVDCGGAICNPCPGGAACNQDMDCTTGHCHGGACVDSCHDGVKDGYETDVDCGYSCNIVCAVGKACKNNGDCVNGFCRADHVCGDPCTDGALDDDEVDVDCGGSCAARCPTGAACTGDGDCQTGVCEATTHRCIVSPCIDGTKDYGESDVDCGHVCPGACGVSRACVVDADCASGVCSVAGLCVASRCQDGKKDGAETNVDCGGGACAGCADGATCGTGADCLSGLCHGFRHFCTSDPCNDGLKDGDEAGIDCGGSKCGPCGLGKACATGSDCASGFCSARNACVESQCRDGRKNGNELDVDCGGSCPLACGQGSPCTQPSDCLSGLCSATTGKCIGNRCLDTVKDGDETDVDCGGTCPTACALGKSCKAAGDCASHICNTQTETCVATRCQDGVRDDAETGVDCGGGTCAACGIGGACSQDSDCTGICAPGSKTCVLNHCFDFLADADETGVDCGGALCGGCKVGVACKLDRDCTSGACGAAGTCAKDRCSDGKVDGTETAIDCGGSCAGCAVGQACGKGTDCGSGACSASTHTCLAGCTTGADCSTTICNAVSGACVTTACQDGVQDGKESGVDCGGGCPTGCGVGAVCAVPADCASGACNVSTLLCVVDHCSDGAKSGDETDVDCGGSLCTPCASSLGCALDSDCQSTLCNQKVQVCVDSHCFDGRKDADEGGVDCGGSTCGKCANGSGCARAADCLSTYCAIAQGVCVADHCQDGVTDAGEGGVDCGAACPSNYLCAVGSTCNNGTDCTTLDCKAGFCANQPANKTCLDWYGAGYTTDGTYTGFFGANEHSIYCDMANGGWQVVWARDSGACAIPTLDPSNGSVAENDATSRMGVGNIAGDGLGQISPEEQSLPTFNAWCYTGGVELRQNLPAAASGPSYDFIRFTAYEVGNKTYTSLAIPRTALLIDWGASGWVLNNNVGGYYWCRGNSYWSVGGGCKGWTTLGDGYDFSTSAAPNTGLTMAELWMNGTYGSGTQYLFGTAVETPASQSPSQPGANQVLWVR